MALDGSGWEGFTRYPVSSGFPQGSILGQIFFLIYINDLSDDVICNIYADDTTL